MTSWRVFFALGIGFVVCLGATFSAVSAGNLRDAAESGAVGAVIAAVAVLLARRYGLFRGRRTRRVSSLLGPPEGAEPDPTPRRVPRPRALPRAGRAR